MKTQFTLLTLLSVFLVFVLACDPATPPPSTPKEETPGGAAPGGAAPGGGPGGSSLAELGISLDSAQTWTHRWQNSTEKAQLIDSAKAFTIPNSDFTQLFKESADSIRAYLALDAINGLHLVFVGVDSLGKDMTGKGDGYYDLTNLCPPVCDYSSPLMPNLEPGSGDE